MVFNVLKIDITAMRILKFGNRGELNTPRDFIQDIPRYDLHDAPFEIRQSW
jgi:hypothetical protein